MKHRSFYLLMLLTISLSTECLFAIPALKTPFKITQPDGTVLTICLHGDEFFNYRTTVDGHLITLNEEGYYTYATLDDKGDFIPSSVRVNEKRSAEEKSFLKQNELRQTINKEQIKKIALRSKTEELMRSDSVKLFPSTGSPKSLVILVNYTDVSFTIPEPQKSFTDMLNKRGYSDYESTGSARDYFRDNSMGVFNPEFVVVGPYTLPQTRAFYGGDKGLSSKNDRQMIKDACQLAAQNGIDFSVYDFNNDGFVDNVFIYYAGENEATGGPIESVWPHRWYLEDHNTVYNGKIIYDYACASELLQPNLYCGIGPFLHEFGHVLGLKDYYGTGDYPGNPVGEWEIMGNGDKNNNTHTPPYYSAYNRFYLGWLKPVELTEYHEKVTLDTLGTSNTAYIITKEGNHNLDGKNPQPAEFFLLENRQQAGWDTYVGFGNGLLNTQHGLIITRIKYDSILWKTNRVNSQYDDLRYVIVKANSAIDGAPYPGKNNITFYHPTLLSGEDIDKPITNICEKDGIITFQFMGTTDNIGVIGLDKNLLNNILNNSENKPVEIFNVMGQLIKTIPCNADMSEITNLPHRKVYILRAGKLSTKIML